MSGDIHDAHAGLSRRLPEIRQAAASECGLACLAMIASFYGRQTDLATLRREFPVSLKGATLATVMQVAERLGLVGRPLRLEIRSPAEPSSAGDLALEHEPFRRAAKPSRTGVIIHDPAFGARRYT